MITTSCDRRAGDAVDRMAAGGVIRLCPPITLRQRKAGNSAPELSAFGAGRLL